MKDCDNALIDAVLTAATRVHRELGPGLLESVYELAMMQEFLDHGIEAMRQVEIPVCYRGKNLGVGFRADIVVEDRLLLELKAIEAITSLHISQVITYLKLMRYKRGFILNFNTKLLKDGIKRVSI